MFVCVSVCMYMRVCMSVCMSACLCADGDMEICKTEVCVQYAVCTGVVCAGADTSRANERGRSAFLYKE